MISRENNVKGMGLKELCRLAAAQGAVLLKNEENILPITGQERVAVFGRAQIDFYRSGTGSGGAVNAPYSTNLLDGLRQQEGILPDEELIRVYQSWRQEHPFDNGGGGWAAEPWSQEEMPVSRELAAEAAKRAEKALVVIGRTAGEDKDNLAEPGSYYLTETEKDMLKTVSAYFSHTALIFNVGNLVDMSFLSEPEYQNIKAVLYVWHGGMEGGNSGADVICGKVTPSGKLADTAVISLTDHLAHKNHGGEHRNLYQEDIYVGYRYFETFAPDRVLYPFGFGLSYTTFGLEVLKTEFQGEGRDTELSLMVKVRNTGNQYEGKEVVQLYVEAPQGKLGRPARELAAFGKTSLLAPGEEEVIELRLSLKKIGAYDETGVTGYPSSYVLEAGEYHFYIGTDVRSAKSLTAGYTIAENILVERCVEAMAPTEEFERIRPGVRKEDGTYLAEWEKVPTGKTDIKKRIADRMPGEWKITGDKEIKLIDVKEGRAKMTDFIAQLNEEDLAAIVRGEGMCSPKVTEGTASAFGGVTDRLLDYGIPIACCADGPSGIRMDNGAYASQLPIGTLLACTFDVSLVEMLFSLQRQELEENNVDILLGPGTNIHRHPLNGRNFEYFSEDPLVSGSFAAAVVKGLGHGKVTGAVKHFACNSQEYNRSNVNSVVSERAIREIYLRPFEIAVKVGKAKAIMTAYNPVNGYWSASNYDLNTTILREEWGFQGIVMTDWWAKMNDCEERGEASGQKTRDMVRSQNDIYMVVSNNGPEVNASEDDTIEALSKGRLNLGELQRCAVNICRFLMENQAMDRIGEMKRDIVLFPAKKDGQQYDRKESECYCLKDTEGMVALRYKRDVWFQVEKAGVYDVTARIMSPTNSIAQNIWKTSLNGNSMSTVQTNGTDGKWALQKLIRIELEKGWYHLELDFVKAEMEVEAMWFKEIGM